VPAQGTDNVVFRLGGELSVRLPRKPAAVRGLLVERVWFPRLAPRLPLAVPMPVAAGEPSEVYPFPWTVCSWVSGMPLPPGGLGSGDVACWPTSSWRCGRWTRLAARRARASRRARGRLRLGRARCSLRSKKRGPARVHQSATRTRASVMLSWPPASIAAFHSSKAARLSSDSSSRSLRVSLPTGSVSPSLQISQRTSVDCGNADTCGSTSA
jgi:hypothetical protein